jgi:hypothetical protein
MRVKLLKKQESGQLGKMRWEGMRSDKDHLLKCDQCGDSAPF